MSDDSQNRKCSIKKFLIKYWTVILFISIISLIPILLNVLIIQPSFFKFVGADTDWLDFWVTYISAIASFAMVFITLRTLKQNDKLLKQNEIQLQQNNDQLNELRHQWNEENRPRLEVYFVKDDIINKGLRIEIVNLGKQTARDINIHIDKAVIDSAPNEKTKKSLNKIGVSFPILLPYDSSIISLCEEKIIPSGKYDYSIGKVTVEKSAFQDFENTILSKEVISITGTYNSIYNIEFSICPNEKKDSYKDTSKSIAEVCDAINRLNFRLSEYGIIIKGQNKNETK